EPSVADHHFDRRGGVAQVREVPRVACDAHDRRIDLVVRDPLAGPAVVGDGPRAETEDGHAVEPLIRDERRHQLSERTRRVVVARRPRAGLRSLLLAAVACGAVVQDVEDRRTRDAAGRPGNAVRRPLDALHLVDPEVGALRSPSTTATSASGSRSGSHRRRSARGGRSRHATTSAAGYSTNERKRSGATSALNAPPSTPPSPTNRKNSVRRSASGRSAASLPWQTSPTANSASRWSGTKSHGHGLPNAQAVPATPTVDTASATPVQPRFGHRQREKA